MPKRELSLDSPLMNAAGVLGFSPDPKSPVEVSRFGAFVTNPVSLQPRSPARGKRYLPFPGGFLIHTGYPNPGLSGVLRQHGRRWANSPVPVIVHLLAADPASLRRMVERLEGLDGVAGVEVGLPPDVHPDAAGELALAATGELAVIVRVPFERCTELGGVVAGAAINAISLGAPRGMLPAPGPSSSGEVEGVRGRLYGPAMFPQCLEAVKILAELGLPVIGAGGVYDQRDFEAMLSAGALAVQLDAVLWRGGLAGP